ncbi:hypothetical protein [Streptomyces sp. NPDC005989]|uniref:hypothetical protein n=1 Tax=Streptomyces sp. NPDC005989 TaxID=3156727 RepID=UPI00340B4EE1
MPQDIDFDLPFALRISPDLDPAPDDRTASHAGGGFPGFQVRWAPMSVADNTTVAPLPLQDLNADLQIDPVIAQAKDLTLTNEVSIDGSVTLTVRYL